MCSVKLCRKRIVSYCRLKFNSDFPFALPPYIAGGGFKMPLYSRQYLVYNVELGKTLNYGILI